MPADTDTAAITDAQTSEIETYLTDIAQGVSQLLPESAQSSWQLILQHPILGALLMAIASYIIAISFRSLLASLIGRITGLKRPSVEDAVMKDLRKPIFNTIFFLGLSLAVVVANLPLGGVTLIKIFLSFITASWMGAVIKISTLALQALSRENRFQLVDARTVPLLDLTSKLLSIMIGSYVLLIIWGVNPVGWLASAGIVGLALGFAAKDTLGNLFSGFFIVADAPYKIGDYINLDSGERGKVCAIGLRSTRLLTRDDVEITIPNGVIANAKIINESGGPLSLRIRIIVGVAYGSDADQVVQLLLKAGTEHSEVCKLPEPRVRLRGFGASSLDFNLMCWITKPEDRGRIAHELHMTIYRLFNEYGVEIPYAKRDLYIKQWPKDNSQE